MRVFLTGGTGYTGAVVLEALLDAGHEVVALTRPRPSDALPKRPGLAWVTGDFGTPEVIHDQARTTDATVHIGAAHGADNAEMERLDGLVIRTVESALADTGKAFVNTSAAPVYGETGATPRDESEPIVAPLPARAWRLRHDRTTVAMAERGVRSVVIRPPNIYGRAGGVAVRQIRRAQTTGKALVIGGGEQRSSVVHVEALARLYLLALASEAAQGVYNAASDEIVRSRDVAEVIAGQFGPGIEIEEMSLETARASLGLMADISAMNCVIGADRARLDLGWSPAGPSYIGELVVGSYRAIGRTA